MMDQPVARPPARSTRGSHAELHVSGVTAGGGQVRAEITARRARGGSPASLAGHRRPEHRGQAGRQQRCRRGPSGPELPTRRRPRQDISVQPPVRTMIAAGLPSSSACRHSACRWNGGLSGHHREGGVRSRIGLTLSDALGASPGLRRALCEPGARRRTGGVLTRCCRGSPPPGEGSGAEAPGADGHRVPDPGHDHRGAGRGVLMISHHSIFAAFFKNAGVPLPLPTGSLSR
jgi:hypothetical protein